jgi:ATP-dependent DNA helicase DinG
VLSGRRAWSDSGEKGWIFMLKPFGDEIRRLAFVYAHSGRLEDESNRIYSIAAAIIEPDGTSLEFKSHVRYSKFTERDRFYSNLSKDLLQSAPAPKEVEDQLRNFLKDHKFIFAFNNFDNLNDVKAFCGSERAIDLSFASEFFIPHLESHAPVRVWEYLFNKKRDRISFSASEVVALSRELARHICDVHLNDARHPGVTAIRYYLKKSDTLFGNAFIHMTRNYRNYFGGLFDPYALPDTKHWKIFLKKAKSSNSGSRQDPPYRKISPEDMETWFHDLSDSCQGYEYRPSQVEYAGHVADALNDKAILCIEAGTGTGKTQGYLIPVMEFLRRNQNARVAVSTYTKSLQQQIFQREIALTKAHFKIYAEIPVALLKGKSSYICVEKLDDAYDDDLKGDRLLTWLYLLNGVYHYRKADIDSIGEKVRKYLDGHYFLTHTIGIVSAKSGCGPKHVACPAQVVTAEARGSRLIITNHHKLALLDQDPVLSGLFANLIIDEGNHFEDAVRNAYTIQADSKEIDRCTIFLESAIRKIVGRAKTDLERNLHKSLEATAALRRHMAELRDVLFFINPHLRLMEGNLLPYNHPKFKSGHLKNHLAEIREDIGCIDSGLKPMLEDDIRGPLKITSRTAGKIRAELGLLNDFSESLKIIQENGGDSNSSVFYMAFKRHFVLTAAPVEVNEIIQNHIYKDKDCIVYTAATLCHKNSFDCFKEIVGLNRPSSLNSEEPSSKKIGFKAIPSPFSPDAITVMVPEDAVSGRYDNKKAWLDWVVKVIPELIIQNKGRTLVLFSSYDDLRNVSEKISDDIINAMYPLLIQQSGIPTVNLCDEFRTVKESVLFGVDTFWYGVDFKGDTLTQVIITRIPYPSPKDPIQMSRKAMIPPDRYWRRYVYDKDIKLKQGIGRLIRSQSDRGKVFILDSRFKVRDFFR